MGESFEFAVGERKTIDRRLGTTKKLFLELKSKSINSNDIPL
jgi:hypothetical protein